MKPPPRCTKKRLWCGGCLLVGLVAASASRLFYQGGNLPVFSRAKNHKHRASASNQTHPNVSTPHDDGETKAEFSSKEDDFFWNRSLTLLVHGRGELGNHLHLLAQARRVQRFVERGLPGVSLHVVLQHQASRKWVSPIADLQQCFFQFRNFTGQHGKWDDRRFPAIQQAQKAWLGDSGHALLTDVQTPEHLTYLRSLLLAQQQQSQMSAAVNQSIGSIPPPITNHGEFQYSLPYLTVKSFVNISSLFGDRELYDDLRLDWFQFDTETCCQTLAASDETVFHFRNFVTEMPKRHRRFLELSPNETVKLLFGNHTAGGNATTTSKQRRKVVILSRFVPTARPYLAAFQHHGWDARLIAGQSGVQDFCLALSAQRELVGLSKSSYAQWAGWLGNATRIRWYRVVENATLAPGLLQQQVHALQQGNETRIFSVETYNRQETLTYEWLRRNMDKPLPP